MLIPVIHLNNSPATWGKLPLPTEALLILPGMALAYAINWGNALGGIDGFTSMTMATGLAPVGRRYVLTLARRLLPQPRSWPAVVCVNEDDAGLFKRGLNRFDCGCLQRVSALEPRDRVR